MATNDSIVDRLAAGRGRSRQACISGEIEHWSNEFISCFKSISSIYKIDAADRAEALAEAADCLEEAIAGRMLDPRHATRIGRLEKAPGVLGRRLVVEVGAV